MTQTESSPDQAYFDRNLGRSAIGIDVNPIYSEIVKKRLQWGMGLDIEHEIIEKVLS